MNENELKQAQEQTITALAKAQKVDLPTQISKQIVLGLYFSTLFWISPIALSTYLKWIAAPFPIIRSLYALLEQNEHQMDIPMKN